MPRARDVQWVAVGVGLAAGELDEGGGAQEEGGAEETHGEGVSCSRMNEQMNE
jgi:hypothetical protein